MPTYSSVPCAQSRDKSHSQAEGREGIGMTGWGQVAEMSFCHNQQQHFFPAPFLAPGSSSWLSFPVPHSQRRTSSESQVTWGGCSSTTRKYASPSFLPANTSYPSTFEGGNQVYSLSLYFLEKFQVCRKIKRKVQRSPTFLVPTHAQPPSLPTSLTRGEHLRQLMIPHGQIIITPKSTVDTRFHSWRCTLCVQIHYDIIMISHRPFSPP